MSAKPASPRIRSCIEHAGVVLFYLVVWAVLSSIVNQPLLLPSPSAVLGKLASFVPQPAFWQTLGCTMARTVCAYLLGIALAIVFCALCCRFRAADLLLSPLLSAVRATPVASFIVLALVWLSAARVPVFTGLLMTLPVVFSALTSAVRTIDPQLMEMARLYRFGPRDTLFFVIIPAVMPAFAQSCMTSIGLCWKAVVAAEVIGVPRLAVGSRLHDAKVYLETDSLLAWTFTLVLLSVLLEKLLRRIVRQAAEVRHD